MKTKTVEIRCPFYNCKTDMHEFNGQPYCPLCDDIIESVTDKHFQGGIMKTKSTHTTTPWKKFGYTITAGEGKGYICVMQSNTKPPFHDSDIEADRALQEANAASYAKMKLKILEYGIRLLEKKS